ncbi:acyl-CoA dehydrogenase family protein [Streptomyces sp. NPDC005492]|uniref:acyl-CoA dehydrogenase family protein n=1 Tax=Streptomyces sp. NPDC005492 TaxID=3156883 RepID=UPI0033BDA115
MDASFTAEQDEIRRTLRELLTRRCGPDELRAALDTPAGHDPALWAALADGLGLPGLALPESYDGVGCTTTELALACEELGRSLAPSPLLATAVLVAPLVLALGTDAQRARLLPRIAAGSLTAALAVPGTALTTALTLTGDNGGEWAGGGRAGGVQARREGEAGWRLYGQVAQVLDGHSADLLLVAAHAGGFARSRTLLFLVAGDAEGIVRTRQIALDATRPQARLELRDVKGELLGVDDGPAVLRELSALGDTVAVVLAAEAVGAADRVLELTVQHVGQREQFGRAIGSFQAVKHRLADVYVQVQAAKSAAYYAAWATVHGERVGALALAQALESLRAAAAEGIQLHGGIGFTWEHEAHLYFKRSAGDELLFGPVHRLRAYAAEGARLFENREVTV